MSKAAPLREGRAVASARTSCDRTHKALDLEIGVFRDQIEMPVSVKNHGFRVERQVCNQCVGERDRHPFPAQRVSKASRGVPSAFRGVDPVQPTQTCLQPVETGLVGGSTQQLKGYESACREQVLDAEVSDSVTNRLNRRPAKGEDPDRRIDETER